MSKYVDRNDVKLMEAFPLWKTMIDTESHHTHRIILVDGVYRWEQVIEHNSVDINQTMIDFYRNGHNKNSEEVRAFYRNIGYSLYGYWELVYWDVNNPDASDYKQPK